MSPQQRKMLVDVTSYAFLSPVPFSSRSTSSRFTKRCLSKARPRFLCYQLAPQMAASLPDDTALDMLSFALSGPGLVALAVFCIGGAALTFSFAEVGPRRGTSLQQSSFLLRITLPTLAKVELPNGTVKDLPAGETVLRLHSYEACTAVARALEQPGVAYAIYRADPAGIRTLTTYPKSVDAKGGVWPRGVVQQADEGLLEARWEEYQRLGGTGDIDKEWRAVVNQLSPIQAADEKECKLCGGTGTVRCYRCGGVCRRGGVFLCDCNDGRRACDWCNPSDA